MPSASNFFYGQLFAKIPMPTASFASKTVAITGASGVLAKETVKHTIRLGASRVIFGVRNLEKGNEAKKEVEAATQCKSDVIQVWEVDLESPAAIKGFVDRMNKLDRVGVVINNAGLGTKFDVHETYGTERIIAVNTIGTLLFAIQMIPKLRDTAARYHTIPVMTTITSAFYDIAKWPDIPPREDLFSVFKNPRGFNIQSQYNLSKLLVLYGVIKMAQIVDPPNISPNPYPIVINQMNPLFLKTDLAREAAGIERALFKVFEASLARPAEVGARLVVTAASSGRETHGRYMERKLEEYAPIAKDEKKMNLFWDTLCKKLEEVQPGVLENLKT
jgi:retinol dehydrogenase 12